MLTLANARCRATFSPHGAELTSFALDGRDYLWAADPAVWGRHSPVLFPIVGRLPDDTYWHQGRAYRLPQHGFARDREFILLSHNAVDLTFELRDTTLRVSWQVRNPDEAAGPLLFSIGAHPAFRCPLRPEQEVFEDYFFAFDHPVTLRKQLLREGLRSGETATVLTEENELALRYELFADDALVFAD